MLHRIKLLIRCEVGPLRPFFLNFFGLGQRAVLCSHQFAYLGVSPSAEIIAWWTREKITPFYSFHLFLKAFRPVGLKRHSWASAFRAKSVLWFGTYRRGVALERSFVAWLAKRRTRSRIYGVLIDAVDFEVCVLSSLFILFYLIRLFWLNRLLARV